MRTITFTVGLLVAVLSAAPAQAVGYWNLPSNKAQWWGIGMGAGHHACFVLGPITMDNVLNHREVRLPHAPSPPCYGCGGCDFNYAESLQFAPYEPTFAPEAVSPEPAPAEGIFAAPVEQ